MKYVDMNKNKDLHKEAYVLRVYMSVTYVDTVPLNYNFILTCVVPRSILHVNCQRLLLNLISMRRDVALPRVVFTRDVKFTCDGNMTFSRDAIVLTKLSNW